MNNMILPKWPGLLVWGRPVNTVQASIIIIRTMPSYLSGADQIWMNKVSNILDIDSNGIILSEEEIKTLKDRLGFLELFYLYNERIMSLYTGGIHGWCNWDGRIYCNSFNIGKWPSVNELFDEWSRIAESFPFLDLESQILDKSIGFFEPEYQEQPKPLIKFSIKDGKVKIQEDPGDTIVDLPIYTDPTYITLKSNAYMQKGCRLDVLEAAVKNAEKYTKQQV